MCIVFKDKMLFTLNRLQYSVDITFICTGKPENSSDLLYCMVWNGAHNTSSQICLLEVGGRLNTGVGQAWALVVWKPL